MTAASSIPVRLPSQRVASSYGEATFFTIMPNRVQPLQITMRIRNQGARRIAQNRFNLTVCIDLAAPFSTREFKFSSSLKRPENVPQQETLNSLTAWNLRKLNALTPTSKTMEIPGLHVNDSNTLVGGNTSRGRESGAPLHSIHGSGP